MRVRPSGRIAALLFVLFSVPAFLGTAYGARDLYLEVHIDGQSTELVAAFHEDDVGRLSATASELTEIGLRVPSGASPDALVALDALAGVRYAYHEAEQRIAFATSAVDTRVARVFRAEPAAQEAGVAEDARQDLGLVVNYAFGTAGHYDDGTVSGLDRLAGQVDTRLSTAYGTLSTGSLAAVTLRGPDDGDGWQDRGELTRLDTAWTFSDTKRRMAYRAGDLVTGGLSWTRPVRLGGAQVARDLSIRPDLVTVPLPDVSGSAAVPSTVEVLVNGARAFRGSVPAGPFEIADVPVPAGRSDATLVVEDALGNRTEQDLTLAAPPTLLAKGLFSFSAAAGLPRRNYGVKSFDYARTPVGAVTGRAGVADWLTLEAHAEGGTEVLNGGIGAVAALGHLGTVEGAVAASRSGARSGFLVSGGLRLEHDLGMVSLRSQRRFGDYDDIASTTAVCEADQPFCGAVPLAIDQVSLALGRAIGGFETSVSYAEVVAADSERSRLLTFGASRAMPRRSSLSLRGVWEPETDEFAFYGGLSMPLGDWGHASLQVENAGLDTGLFGAQHLVGEASEGRRVGLTVSRHASGERGLDGRAHIERHGTRTLASLGATYNGEKGRLSGSVHGKQGADGRMSGTLNLAAEGAIVVMDGVHATQRVEDAFVVVDAGVPGAKVLRENREVGVTGRRGRLLVPDLRGLEPNRIAISPEGLPANVILGETEAIVVPRRLSGLRQSFAVSTGESAALAVFVDETGTPLPVGTIGTTQDGSEVMIGYDGETWIDGLREDNVITFRISAASGCRARFAFRRGDAAQAHLGAVPCVGGVALAPAPQSVSVLDAERAP